MSHQGHRDGHAVEGKVWRKVLLLSLEKPPGGLSQGEVVQAFLDRLAEMAARAAPEIRRKPRKFSEAEALEYHAADFLEKHGWPKNESLVPGSRPDQR